MSDAFPYKPDQKFTPELRSVGWAPGDYICRCRDCGSEHLADKRSFRCLPCANAVLIASEDSK